MQYAFKVKFSERIIEDNIGQLICVDAILARDGAYQYSSDDVFNDGKFHVVELHRDWDDVRKLKLTLEGKPVIYYHPDKNIDITVDNIAEFTIGHIQNIRESKAEGYNVLIGDLFISDKDIIEKIKAGELREISLGYFYDVDDSDKNHLKQVNMVAEHVALVDQGRAGIAKILDADDLFVLAKIRPNGEKAYVEYDGEAEVAKNNKWMRMKKYGFYRFNPYIEFDQASKLNSRAIGMIADDNKTSVLVALDPKTGSPRIGYYFGKRLADVQELLDKDYDLDFGEDNEIDPYEVPDEVNTPEPVVQPASQKVIRSGLVHQLQSALNKVFADERHYGYLIGTYSWQKLVQLVEKHTDEIAAVTGYTGDIDEDDEEILHVVRSYIQASKKAHDSSDFISLIVVTFDAEKSDIQYASSIAEAIKIAGKGLKKCDNIQDFIDQANEVDGVWICRLSDFDDREIIVSKAYSAEDVMLTVASNIDELNKELSTYFADVEAAYEEINLKEGRFAAMSAILL